VYKDWTTRSLLSTKLNLWYCVLRLSNTILAAEVKLMILCTKLKFSVKCFFLLIIVCSFVNFLLAIAVCPYLCDRFTVSEHLSGIFNLVLVMIELNWWYCVLRLSNTILAAEVKLMILCTKIEQHDPCCRRS
jgi:hypothetical protein